MSFANGVRLHGASIPADLFNSEFFVKADSASDAHILCIDGKRGTTSPADSKWTIIYDRSMGGNAAETNHSLVFATYCYIGTSNASDWQDVIYRFLYNQSVLAEHIYPAWIALQAKKKAAGANTSPGAFLSHLNRPFKAGSPPSILGGMSYTDDVDFDNTEYNNAMNGGPVTGTHRPKVKVVVGNTVSPNYNGPAIYVITDKNRLDAAREVAYNNHWKGPVRPIAVVMETGDIATNIRMAEIQLNSLQYLSTTFKPPNDIFQEISDGLDKLGIDDDDIKKRFESTLIA